MSKPTPREKRETLRDYMYARSALQDAQARFDPLAQKAIALLRHEGGVLGFNVDGHRFVAQYEGGSVVIKKLTILDELIEDEAAPEPSVEPESTEKPAAETES